MWISIVNIKEVIRIQSRFSTLGKWSGFDPDNITYICTCNWIVVKIKSCICPPFAWKTKTKNKWDIHSFAVPPKTRVLRAPWNFWEREQMFSINVAHWKNAFAPSALVNLWRPRSPTVKWIATKAIYQTPVNKTKGQPPNPLKNPECNNIILRRGKSDKASFDHSHWLLASSQNPGISIKFHVDNGRA